MFRTKISLCFDVRRRLCLLSGAVSRQEGYEHACSQQSAKWESVDYKLSIPGVCLYRSQGDDWEKLQISGPLFVLILKGQAYPQIFVMNNSSFRCVKDLLLPVPPMTMLQEGNKLYIKVEEGITVMIATDCEDDAMQLKRVLDIDEDPVLRHLNNVLLNPH